MRWAAARAQHLQRLSSHAPTLSLTSGAAATRHRSAVRSTLGVGPSQSLVPGLQDIIGRLMILCARQPGLSGVWEALFQTEGKPVCRCSALFTC